MVQLLDGTGKGFLSRVDANFRLHTQSVTESEGAHSTEVGDAYNINTGNITFSAAGSLLFISNTEDKDLVIETLVIGVGTAGGTSDMGEITIASNDTAGDLGFSDNTAVSMNANRNFGSSKTLSATVYKGKSGGTSTGGADVILAYSGTNTRVALSIGLILPKGNNIAVTYDPKLSSGSVKAYCACICHLKDPASS